MSAVGNVWDALIIGGGPAGLAAAIVLAGNGLRVAVIDRARDVPRSGETLSPAGTAVLRTLGGWEQFRCGPHQPCYAYSAVWGGPELTYHDGLRDPRGHAWVVDRPALTGALRHRAHSLGTFFVTWSGPLSFGRHGPGWTVRSGSDREALLARFIVDASGRAGSAARRLGARRSVRDRQVALVATILGDAAASVAEPILVEAVQGGWWYSARTPAGSLILSFFTDRDLLDLRTAREEASFRALLRLSRVTRERVAAKGDRALAGRPVIVAADCSRLDRVWGEGWIAAGDAALAYDPLSGHGLTVALASGRDAALAVRATLAGDAAALPRYGASLARAFRSYEVRRATQYVAERRWARHPFWRRRIGSRPKAPVLPRDSF